MDAGHAHHVSLERDGGLGSTRSGRKRGKKEAWERSNVVTGTAAGGSLEKK
jgi:hypothetical protein